MKAYIPILLLVTCFPTCKFQKDNKIPQEYIDKLIGSWSPISPNEYKRLNYKFETHQYSWGMDIWDFQDFYIIDTKDKYLYISWPEMMYTECIVDRIQKQNSNTFIMELHRDKNLNNSDLPEHGKETVIFLDDDTIEIPISDFYAFYNGFMPKKLYRIVKPKNRKE